VKGKPLKKIRSQRPKMDEEASCVTFYQEFFDGEVVCLTQRMKTSNEFVCSMAFTREVALKLSYLIINNLEDE